MDLNFRYADVSREAKDAVEAARAIQRQRVSHHAGCPLFHHYTDMLSSSPWGLTCAHITFANDYL